MIIKCCLLLHCFHLLLRIRSDPALLWPSCRRCQLLDIGKLHMLVSLLWPYPALLLCCSSIHLELALCDVQLCQAVTTFKWHLKPRLFTHQLFSPCTTISAASYLRYTNLSLLENGRYGHAHWYEYSSIHNCRYRYEYTVLWCPSHL